MSGAHRHVLTLAGEELHSPHGRPSRLSFHMYFYRESYRLRLILRRTHLIRIAPHLIEHFLEQPSRAPTALLHPGHLILFQLYWDESTELLGRSVVSESRCRSRHTLRRHATHTSLEK